MSKNRDKTKKISTPAEVTGNPKSKFREFAEAIVLALILALFIRTFVIQAFKIPSSSMEPTLLVGDHILVNKFIYGFNVPFSNHRILAIRRPERGDVIVFRYPKDERLDFIKRCIAVGGETVEVRDKVVFVNGKPIHDPHGVHRDHGPILEGRDNFGPVTVPKGKIFVMGDNRDNSNDSRFWGFVDLSKVLGEAVVIYWSWNGAKFWPRWGRMGEVIH